MRVEDCLFIDSPHYNHYIVPIFYVLFNKSRNKGFNLIFFMKKRANFAI